MNWTLIIQECGCKKSIYEENEDETFYHACSNPEHIKECDKKNKEIHKPKPPIIIYSKICGCKKWKRQDWMGEYFETFTCGKCAKEFCKKKECENIVCSEMHLL